MSSPTLHDRSTRIANIAGPDGSAYVRNIDGEPVVIVDGPNELTIADRLERSQDMRVLVVAREHVIECAEHRAGCEQATFLSMSAGLPLGWMELNDGDGNLEGFACPTCCGSRVRR